MKLHLYLSLTITLILSLLLKKYEYVYYPGYFMDDAKYYIGAESIYKYGKYLDNSLYVSKPMLTFPPLYSLIISISFAFNNPVLVMRIINTMLLILALYFIYNSSIFKTRKNNIVFYSISTSSYLILFTNAIMAEIAYLFFLYLLLKLSEKNPNPIVKAILTAALFYLKPYAVAVVVALTIDFIKLKKIKSLILYIFLTLILISIWFIYVGVLKDVRVAQYFEFVKLISKETSYLEFIARNLYLYSKIFIELGLLSGAYLKSFIFITSIIILVALLYIRIFTNYNIYSLYFIFHTITITYYAPLEARYVIPLIPLIHIFLLNSIETRLVKIVVFMPLIVFNFVALAHKITSFEAPPRIFSYIKEKTEPNSLIITGDGSSLYLLTNRKHIPIGRWNYDGIFKATLDIDLSVPIYIYIPNTSRFTEFTRKISEPVYNFIKHNLNYEVIKLVYDNGDILFKLNRDEKSIRQFKELETAIENIIKNNYQEAKEIASKLYNEDTEFLGVYLILLELYEREKNYKKIFEVSEKSTKRYPLQPQILYYNAIGRKSIGLPYEEVLKKALNCAVELEFSELVNKIKKIQ
ncbi:MAG: hypothetical protein NZ870_01430 [bacterium]|nr:hypothetical protein [bacterium]